VALLCIVTLSSTRHPSRGTPSQARRARSAGARPLPSSAQERQLLSLFRIAEGLPQQRPIAVAGAGAAALASASIASRFFRFLSLSIMSMPQSQIKQ